MTHLVYDGSSVGHIQLGLHHEVVFEAAGHMVRSVA